MLVKLKTVAEIRRSSDGDTFIVESVYLVLNSLLDWKPVGEIETQVNYNFSTGFQSNKEFSTR